MYDKNRIEDSLEFVRQLKEFYDSDDTLDEFDPLEDNDSDELFVNLAYHMEPESPHKENVVQKPHAMGDPFAVPDPGVMQEQRRLAEERLRLEQEEARRRQAEQEQQRRLAEERRRLEQEEARRRQAEQEQQKRLAEERRRLEEEAERRRQAELQEKQRQEAERKKIEEERKKLAEEQKRQEEARRQLEEERRLAQEEAKRREAELAEQRRLAEEKQRREQEEARRREAELAEQRRLAEEKQRREQEEARRREAELAEQKRLEEERQRLAQEEAKRKEAELAEKKRLEEERLRLEEEAKRRRQAELQEKQRQEEERRKIEEERRRLAEEQKRQEQARRQLEEERRRLVEEQLQRELEEQRRILAEQARQAQQEKARKEAEEKERRRKLVLEEEKRKQELQAREEERRRQEEEAKKQQEAEQQSADIPNPASDDTPDSEIDRLRKRAEELKRQAEMATLEARMRQLQLEAEGISTGESVMAQQADMAGNSITGAASVGTAAANMAATNTAASNNIPMPMLSIPGVQPGAMVSNTAQNTVSANQYVENKPKLSKEEIDSIFAKELKKTPSSDSSYQQRKVMLQKQAERLKKKREELGGRLPVEIAKEKAIQARDFTMGVVWKLREFVLDKMTDPENAESREKAKKIFSNVLVVAICVCVAFLVSSIVTNFVAHPTKVEGESMETTLTDGDTVIIQKLSYYFGSPDRYDVVVFPIYNSETYFIKRVIGLPGETVQIEEGKILINGKELEDDIYGKDEYIDNPGDAGEPITLASDEYFVLGDNRNMSTDSRSSYVGLIKKKNIVGKAWRRVMPFSKSGKVH